jgi:hypothetical protein
MSSIRASSTRGWFAGLAGVHRHRGDGVTIALERWNLLGRAARPLFFVDGDHACASVLRELSAIFDAIGDASTLVHDTFFQPAESGYNVGPARAIASQWSSPALDCLA